MDGLIQALCTSLESLGGLMAVDATSANNVSASLLVISSVWAGTAPSTPPPQGSPPPDPFNAIAPEIAGTLNTDGIYCPTQGTTYSAAEVGEALTYLVQQAQGANPWPAGLKSAAEAWIQAPCSPALPTNNPFSGNPPAVPSTTSPQNNMAYPTSGTTYTAAQIGQALTYLAQQMNQGAGATPAEFQAAMNAWAGATSPIANPFVGTPALPCTMTGDKPYPDSNALYTTEQGFAVMSWLASMISQNTGSGDSKYLEAWQATSSAWTNALNGMNSFKDMQTSPFNTMQQGESSQIQQDQSSISGNASLGQGLAEVTASTANLVTLLG